jgi:hypothetical protein
MKQYTNESQTAKLIELGFEKPRYATMFWRDNKEVTEINYTLGELIEMLPSHIGEWELNIWHDWHFERWVMCFDPEKHTSAATELIDAAYNLIVKLKDIQK